MRKWLACLFIVVLSACSHSDQNSNQSNNKLATSSITTPTAKPAEPNAYTSWSVYYEDEIALRETADVVVRGRVLAQQEHSIRDQNTPSMPMTYVRLEVDEVMKGNLVVGDHIVVAQMSHLEGSANSIEGTALQEEQEVVLFLRVIQDNTYGPINEDNGVYISDAKGFYTNIATHKLLDLSKLH